MLACHTLAHAPPSLPLWRCHALPFHPQVRTLQLEMEYVYGALEDEARDVVGDSKVGCAEGQGATLVGSCDLQWHLDGQMGGDIVGPGCQADTCLIAADVPPAGQRPAAGAEPARQQRGGGAAGGRCAPCRCRGCCCKFVGAAGGPK